MFTNLLSVHIPAKLILRDGAMATPKSRITHKHFRLDAVKLKRAQKVLEAEQKPRLSNAHSNSQSLNTNATGWFRKPIRSSSEAASSSVMFLRRSLTRRCRFFSIHPCTSPLSERVAMLLSCCSAGRRCLPSGLVLLYWRSFSQERIQTITRSWKSWSAILREREGFSSQI